MFRLNVKIQGIKKLDRKFSNISRGLDNFREPLMKSNALMRSAIDRNFITSGRELGKPWQSLSPQTLKRKKGNKILIDTGKMRKSFASTITPMSATIVNNTQYFKFHQSDKARSRLPRRIMMRIDKKRENEIVRIFNAYIKKIAK